MLSAVIFDMDGLLLDSEPFWRQTVVAVFNHYGASLTERDCLQTTGLRIDEVVTYWQQTIALTAPFGQIQAEILDGMETILSTQAKPLPGVFDAITLCKEAGFKVGLASSSPLRLINAALTSLNLTEHFDVICSAESEAYGKPHPAVYLTAANELATPPQQCLAIEDSFTGLLAAKSAQMKTMVVPESQGYSDPRFIIADHKLNSLEQFNIELLRIYDK